MKKAILFTMLIFAPLSGLMIAGITGSAVPLVVTYLAGLVLGSIFAIDGRGGMTHLELGTPAYAAEDTGGGGGGGTIAALLGMIGGGGGGFRLSTATA
jgi:hypothetical protein